MTLMFFFFFFLLSFVWYSLDRGAGLQKMIEK